MVSPLVQRDEYRIPGCGSAQLTALLWLTGGLQNPFALLLIAPVTVAAATLPTRAALAVGAVALLATLFLSVSAMPLPWTHGDVLDLPELYRVSVLVATSSGIVSSARASRPR